MDRAAVADWLKAYVRAWESYQPDAIGDLFSEDAIYVYHPFDEPVVGRDAIVSSWLAPLTRRGHTKRVTNRSLSMEM